jgi:hypothetical protein
VSATGPANAAVTSGGLVTIRGLSFGGLVVTPTASLTTTDACSSAAWTSATVVACTPAAYGGFSIRIAVSVSAVVGTQKVQFSFDG